MRVWLVFAHFFEVAGDGLVHNFAILNGEVNLDIACCDAIYGAVSQEHLLAVDISDSAVFATMVVSEKHDVEARHQTSHFKRSVLNVASHIVAHVLSGVEKTDNQVGLFFFLNDWNPFASGFHHVVEAETCPKVFGKPSRNCWGDHAQHGNLHAVALKDDVRLQIWFASLYVDSVGADDRAIALLNPAVVNGVSCFNVVVADIASIILHVV